MTQEIKILFPRESRTPIVIIDGETTRCMLDVTYAKDAEPLTVESLKLTVKP